MANYRDYLKLGKSSRRKSNQTSGGSVLVKTEHPESGLKLTIYPVPVSEINMGVVKLSPLFDKIYVGRIHCYR